MDFPTTISTNTDGLRLMDIREKQTIEDALRHSQGSVKEAAVMTGLSQATIYRKLKRYGIVLNS